MGGSVCGFDELTGALIAIGKRSPVQLFRTCTPQHVSSCISLRHHGQDLIEEVDCLGGILNCALWSICMVDGGTG